MTTDLRQSHFKVLDDRRSIYGTGSWTPGRWRSVCGELVPCKRGIHFCRADQLVYWLGPEIWLFEDGSPDETVDAVDKMVTRRGRVVRKLDTWNDRTARLFAADCAESVVHLIPELKRDPFLAAIVAARAFAHGEISAASLAAAWAAAWAAVWAAVWAPARDAVRAAPWAPVSAAVRAAARDAARAAASDAARAAANDAARAAARDAARAAANDAANAVSAAVRAAASDAASDAARAAANDAWDAARDKQTDRLFFYLRGEAT